MTIKKLLLIMLALALAPEAWALRCGNQLVRVGDHKLDVLDACGEPDYVDRRMGLRGTRLRHPPNNALEIDQFEQVEIEEWTYNFGPRKFRQMLRFENGFLQEIEQLNYGR